jgi:hypothetical protein
MMKIIPLALSFVMLLSTAASAQPADAGQGRAGKGRVTAQTRFATDIPALSATASPLRLALGSLFLTGGRTIEVPGGDYYVATLVSGDVVTLMDGRETTRHSGDTWAVPAGTAMTVRLQGRSHDALLDVFRISKL